MPEDGPCRIHAELLTETSRRIVTELVRMPGRDVGPPARVADGVVKGASVVNLAGGPSRLSLPLPVTLRGGDRRFPRFPATCRLFLHRFPGREQVSPEIWTEPRPKYALGLGSNINDPL